MKSSVSSFPFVNQAFGVIRAEFFFFLADGNAAINDNRSHVLRTYQRLGIVLSPL